MSTQFIEVQKKDKKLNAVRDLLSGNNLPSSIPSSERKQLYRQQQRFHLTREEILCYKKFNRGERLSLIAIPTHLIQKVIHMIHQADGIGNHFGPNNCYMQIKNKFYFEDMLRKVAHYSQSCEFCQRNKRNYKKYGHLRERKLNPNLPYIFQQISIDSIGPYTFSDTNK